MTDATVSEAPTVKPIRRKRRRRTARRKPVAAVTKMPDELAGLSPTECPLECNAKRCVISDHAYCAHPRKGGLQGSDMGDPAAIDRSHRARNALARAAIDKQN